MQELMVDFITSLDGYAAAEGWPGFWGMEGPEYLAWLDQPDQKRHTTLMGASTYRLFASFADAAPDDDGMQELARMRTFVFSSTLKEPLAWGNTTLIRDDPVDAVRALKQDSDRPLRTIGSLTLCRSLFHAGLVDRFRVVVFPVVTGVTGRERIYDGLPDLRLDLVSTRTFDGRLQLLEYVPTVLNGPPATAPRED